MSFAVVGAGAVGLAIGARLAAAGKRVHFATRTPAQARELAASGVRCEDPATGESWEGEVPAGVGIESLPEAHLGGFVLLCMRTPDLPAAAEALARRAPECVPVGLQNGIGSDALLAKRFHDALGIVVRLTCTRVEGSPTRVVSVGRRLVAGAIAESPNPDTEAATALARALRDAGFDVGLSTRLAEDRWLKLCVNLMSAPNALVRREDHATRAFVETKARLLEEASGVLAAARISARSCDGADRSLEAEIDWQRRALDEGRSARALPVYNQVWAALERGGALEADEYHRRILDLAAGCRLRAPQNARVLAALLRCADAKLGPERLAATDLRVGPVE